MPARRGDWPAVAPCTSVVYKDAVTFSRGKAGADCTASRFPRSQILEVDAQHFWKILPPWILNRTFVRKERKNIVSAAEGRVP